MSDLQSPSKSMGAQGGRALADEIAKQIVAAVSPARSSAFMTPRSYRATNSVAVKLQGIHCGSDDACHAASENVRGACGICVARVCRIPGALLPDKTKKLCAGTADETPERTSAAARAHKRIRSSVRARPLMRLPLSEECGALAAARGHRG